MKKVTSKAQASRAIIAAPGKPSSQNLRQSLQDTFASFHCGHVGLSSVGAFLTQ
eukprot:CAMPEP_0169478028 /NCGR_PEP_ID=MMETSP1042-20121227/28247_1 /TAXON_ID=464988 /ORGANISM="Hemiselmis andersenii, Strain CCMP1180" /LENGTH=53 /DNA_ID=CAMNT_0009592449 /DNA_START=44 /DNA_END=205 /DNA_ORIENTATION=+